MRCGKAVRASAQPSASQVPLRASPIEAIWRDASFEMDAEAPATVHLLSTLGWIMRDDEDALVVAGEADAKRAFFRSFTCIPRECVVSVRELRPYGKPGSR